MVEQKCPNCGAIVIRSNGFIPTKGMKIDQDRLHSKCKKCSRWNILNLVIKLTKDVVINYVEKIIHILNRRQ